MANLVRRAALCLKGHFCFKVNFHRLQNDFGIFMLGVYVYTYFSAFLTILVTQARISAFHMLTQRSTDALLMDSWIRMGGAVHFI